jgi:hypothetical protein
VTSKEDNIDRFLQENLRNNRRQNHRHRRQMKCQAPLTMKTLLQIHTILYLKHSTEKVIAALSDLPYKI